MKHHAINAPIEILIIYPSSTNQNVHLSTVCQKIILFNYKSIAMIFST